MPESKLFLRLLTPLLLAGCATVPAPGISYNEIVVVNQSRTVVRDVQIAATDSGRVFSCGNIAPRGICSNRFRPQPYGGKPVRVVWIVGDGRPREQLVEPQLPQSFMADLPLRGVLVIGARGELSAYLQQDAPGPHL